jgi:nephrocystin-3
VTAVHLLRHNRQIRVFISSTFRDMMAERDLLTKQVFPELRRICARRFVTFTEVDLRWGITKEQSAEGKVLPLCLAEIHRCRPYFIGLLGERYGWIPDAIPADVIESEPWLEEHVHGRTSVTELEILHGVLNNPEMRPHAFFFFREPEWIDSLPESERHEMVEWDIPADIERHGADEAARRTQERKEKLAALKDRIRQSGLPVEEYSSPEDLARTIRNQFVRLIDQLYPGEDLPNPLDRERLAHEAHAKDRLFACIARPKHLATLNFFADAEGDGKGLVVTGESGSGKSALLAAWTRDWTATHPNDFCFQHYFGSTPESASVDSFLRRLLGEIKRRFDIGEDVPNESDKLREALPLWLAQTVGRERIVLVLDGLNQVQGSEPDRRLAWLPRFFPPHVTVLASSLTGPALDAARERGWYENNLPLTDEVEIEAMVDAYLGEYRKTLDPGLKRDLIHARGSKNPLFLRTVLEELRQFGSYKKLPDRVAHYLEAGNPRDLFVRVLRRWREDFDTGQDLVRRALLCLWVARRGLSESEWLDLVGGDGAPLPRAVWTPLFLAMEPHMTRRAGLFAFGHDFLRQAVASEYLKAENAQHNAHLTLADYFEAQPEMTPRKSDEWPWQLQEAKEWDRLQQALTDRSLFLALSGTDTNVELGRYWVQLRRARPDIGMGTLYLEALACWEEEEPDTSRIASLVGQLGRFLSAAACHEAELLYRRALAIDETSFGRDHPRVAILLNNLATLLHDTNRLSEAEPLYRRALAIDGAFFGPDHHRVTGDLVTLATLLKDTNRLSEAEPLYRRALAIDEASFGPAHHRVAGDLNDLAALLQGTNRLSEAEPLMRRALAIDEASLGPDHPLVARDLNNLATLLKDTNRLSEAEPLIRRALEIWEASVGPDHPKVAIALSNLVALLYATNRLSEAESVARRALEINEASLGPDHPLVARGLNNLAILLQATNRMPEAEPLMRRMVEIFINFTRATGHPHPHLHAAANNYCLLLEAMGRSQDEIRAHLRNLAPEFF